MSAGPWNISRDDYFRDRTAVNHSSLEVFRRSRRLYCRRFVLGDLADAGPTEAMRRGTWLHLAVLEPEKWKRSLEIAPDVNRRTKQGRQDLADLEAYCEREGKCLLTGPEAAQIDRMADAVRSDPLVGRWLEMPGLTEQVIRWTDPLTGILCKAMLDRVVGEVEFDLKTAADPEPYRWVRSAHQLGYHRQAAHYLEGALHALGLLSPCFVHVVVGSEEPHEVYCCELSADDLDLGRRQTQADLEALRQCRDTGCWDDPRRGTVVEVRLPRYAHDEF